MRYLPLKVLFLVSILVSNNCKAQSLEKGFLEQGFEYYFESQNFEAAMIALDSIYTNYDLKSVKLDIAIKVAVKYKRKGLTSALLQQVYHDFNQDQSVISAYVGEWLGDTTFSFARFFGSNWPKVSKSLNAEKQNFEDNLKSEYYSALMAFLNVDQFVRINSVSPETFNQVDSINLDNFTNWLIEWPKSDHIKSRLNSQIITVLLRHVGQKRFEKLSGKGVFDTLLRLEIISAQDYGLMYDYVRSKPMYFVDIDAFIEENWKKTGLLTLGDLKNRDQQRLSVGLLPLEYSGFCIRKNLVVPPNLKYAAPIESFIYRRK